MGGTDFLYKFPNKNYLEIINQTDYKLGEVKSYLEDLKVSKVYSEIKNILG